MQILNIGSINIDHVYEVEHFVRPGETLNGLSYNIFAGGKGFNQSVALARAGATVLHAGRIGKQADWLVEFLQQQGVDTTFINRDEQATGHAIIQVVPSGENAIVLYGGANQAITRSDIEVALSSCSSGDYLLLQNETSAVAEAMQLGHDKGLRIVFNPAPMNAAVQAYPLNLVDIFILNETEAEGLTGQTDPHGVCTKMREQYPYSSTVLTLGKQGATYFDAKTTHHAPAVAVNAVDTTAAGDTFIGFFLAELSQSNDPGHALRLGCLAAAVCVTRAGASNSIPLRKEVEVTQLDKPSVCSKLRR